MSGIGFLLIALGIGAYGHGLPGDVQALRALVYGFPLVTTSLIVNAILR